ncbi:unnamed protein product, partial [Mesorhabditis belari]|uniref:Profilin n=1 Tax=Mesorhabditis belari TaxID=2138241 RepID=A0AAF3FE42_9BILA
MTGWDAYISNLTASSPHIQRAAIVGFPDGSVWARTEGGNKFEATEKELKKLVAGFNNPNDVPTHGADLENVHYIVPQADDGVIFGKKDKSGFFAAKTQSAVLIAVFKGESAEGTQISILYSNKISASQLQRLISFFRCPLLQQCVIHGDSTHSQLVGIIVSDLETFVPLCSTFGFTGSLMELCEDKEVKSIIVKRLKKHGRQEGLHGFEQVWF